MIALNILKSVSSCSRQHSSFNPYLKTIFVYLYYFWADWGCKKAKCDKYFSKPQGIDIKMKVYNFVSDCKGVTYRN